MTCDEAFECLTDPDRRPSDELDRHLAGCPRCRHMQETLAPALLLFDHAAQDRGEFPPTADFDMLFEDWEEAIPAAAAGVAESAPEAVAPEDVALFELTEAAPDRSPLSRFSRRCAALAAAFAGGAALAALLLALAWPEDHAGGSALARGFDRCTWLHREEAQRRGAADHRSIVLSCVACHLEAPSAR